MQYFYSDTHGLIWNKISHSGFQEDIMQSFLFVAGIKKHGAVDWPVYSTNQQQRATTNVNDPNRRMVPHLPSARGTVSQKNMPIVECDTKQQLCLCCVCV